MAADAGGIFFIIWKMGVHKIIQLRTAREQLASGPGHSEYTMRAPGHDERASATRLEK